MNQRKTIFFLYYASAAFIIAIVMGQSDWLTYYRMGHDGINVQAVITNTLCAESSTISYRYIVNGKSLEGSGEDANGNPLCKNLKTGDPIQIYYLPASPEKNLPGYPSEYLGKETAKIALVALFLPLLLAFTLFMFVRKRKD